MSFKVNSLFRTDGYKIGHQAMLAPGTTRLYGTWIPRSLKHAHKGITKVVSFGQQLTWRWLHDEFQENFFILPKGHAVGRFAKDMALYLGMPFESKHFEQLHDLGYLPIKVKALPEGIETNVNIPHMTFINTVDGFAWLPLYLETIVSSLAWKPSTSATIALLYRRNFTKWVLKTDPDNAFLIPFLGHDFSARGMDPWSMISSGLGHATSFRGSDTLPVIPAARYFYGEPENEVVINSVPASEHSVSTTCIFTIGEQEMISYYMKQFPKGILSIVSDTFDLWKLITEYLPNLKEDILARDGKLVIRPDSGDPVDIICGEPIFYTMEDKLDYFKNENEYLIYGDTTCKKVDGKIVYHPKHKGVIELLWDIFGGTVNAQGYKVLDPHIGAIYGDSITPERQIQIYERLAAKGFAATNIVLGIGSYTYQYNTRDTMGWAAKGGWFEINQWISDISENGGAEQGYWNKQGIDLYKDPATDTGTKKSPKGMLRVDLIDGEYILKQQCTFEEESGGVLQVIYYNGMFYNQQTLTEIRELLNN